MKCISNWFIFIGLEQSKKKDPCLRSEHINTEKFVYKSVEIIHSEFILALTWKFSGSFKWFGKKRKNICQLVSCRVHCPVMLGENTVTLPFWSQIQVDWQWPVPSNAHPWCWSFMPSTTIQKQDEHEIWFIRFRIWLASNCGLLWQMLLSSFSLRPSISVVAKCARVASGTKSGFRVGSCWKDPHMQKGEGVGIVLQQFSNCFFVLLLGFPAFQGQFWLLQEKEGVEAANPWTELYSTPSQDVCIHI